MQIKIGENTRMRSGVITLEKRRYCYTIAVNFDGRWTYADLVVHSKAGTIFHAMSRQYRINDLPRAYILGAINKILRELREEYAEE